MQGSPKTTTQKPDQPPAVPNFDATKTETTTWWWGPFWPMLLLTVIVLGSISGGLYAGARFFHSDNTPTGSSHGAASLTQPQLKDLVPLTELTIPIDGPNLLKDDQKAIDDFEQKIQAEPTLQNQSAAVVIVLCEATDPETGQNTAVKVINILMSLKQQGGIFKYAAFFRPLYKIEQNPKNALIDIFVFPKS